MIRVEEREIALLRLFKVLDRAGMLSQGQLSAKRRLRYEQQKGRRLNLLVRCLFVSWKSGGFLIKKAWQKLAGRKDGG